MKIVIDLMGGDKGVTELVRASIDAVNEYDIEAILVGDESLINDELERLTFDKSKIEVVNTEEVISNEDDPVRAIRRKKDSSMVVAANLLKKGKAEGMISTGNTGALLASGLFIIGRIKGIDRAAISVLYPTLKGFSLLLDAGANADCRPEYLYQFAMMGSIYMEKVLGKESPSLGLINVGVEKGKGNKLVNEAYDLLEESELNFIGNVEARDLLEGDTDILVCDGFVGNIALKLTEGLAISMGGLLKDQFMKNTKTKLAAGLMKNELRELKEFMDYREYGGAPLLGVNKPLVKAHGSSDRLAFKNGIKQLIDFINRDIIKDIEEKIEEEEKNVNLEQG